MLKDSTGKLLADLPGLLFIFLTFIKYLVLQHDFQVQMYIMKMTLQLQKTKHIVLLGCCVEQFSFKRKEDAQNEAWEKTFLSPLAISQGHL